MKSKIIHDFVNFYKKNTYQPHIPTSEIDIIKADVLNWTDSMIKIIVT